MYDSPNLFRGASGSVRTGLTGVRSEPEPRTHLTSLLSIATKMVSAPPVPGLLQGGQQVSSTILLYTEKRGRGTFLVAIESTNSVCQLFDKRSLRADCWILKLFYPTDPRNTDRPTHESLRKNSPIFEKLTCSK